ncbi:uncharacterized protein LOC124716670 isoform X4 [Schistocerca piceifrons]|uniref:uncharacterized protein LOC124716670 isoform X4 n=1 Tax=Schistocerca piceifrons TaxID=274613 RepID=UPI001F5EC58D|nr:uncharacterized protein LOC124716670 isoform X4 [Schistocerca piceifrons]XP_049937576.1 uncharacterized protein LOC126412135 isoform X5 [Schistocerca serialis cubense]
MVGPGAYTARRKPRVMSCTFDETPTYSKPEKKVGPLTDHLLPTNLTLKFDTNVRLQRNSVLTTVTILNALVTAALIVAAVPTSVYVHTELNNSQHKVLVLQEQVNFLTDRYEYILKQLRSVRIRSKGSSLNENLKQSSNNEDFISAQHKFPSQYKDVDSVNSGERSQHLQIKKPSFVSKDVVKESSKGAQATEDTFPPFSEEPHTSRAVAVESDGSQYGTHTLRRTKRSDWRGAAVAHFKGGQPETFIRDGGLVAPWFLDDAASGRFSFSAFQLKQGKAAVEVTESGLYYIYSQIHYLTSQVTNSYSLNLRHGSQSNSSVLSYCSASSGSQTLNEVSCFTSVVRYLNSTDRIFIQQRDMNRRIILRDGYSYLGVVRLSA